MKNNTKKYQESDYCNVIIGQIISLQKEANQLYKLLNNIDDWIDNQDDKTKLINLINEDMSEGVLDTLQTNLMSVKEKLLKNIS